MNAFRSLGDCGRYAAVGSLKNSMENPYSPPEAISSEVAIASKRNKRVFLMGVIFLVTLCTSLLVGYTIRFSVAVVPVTVLGLGVSITLLQKHEIRPFIWFSIAGLLFAVIGSAVISTMLFGQPSSYRQSDQFSFLFAIVMGAACPIGSFGLGYFVGCFPMQNGRK